MIILPRFLLVCALMASAILSSAMAGIEKQEDGTYLLTGTWTFWTDREMLAASGKFDLGEFRAILFKPTVNEFEGVREMKKSAATFKVKARESTSPSGEKVLVVEQILEKVQ
jgi:hypothetical protein